MKRPGRREFIARQLFVCLTSGADTSGKKNKRERTEQSDRPVLNELGLYIIHKDQGNTDTSKAFSPPRNFNLFCFLSSIYRFTWALQFTGFQRTTGALRIHRSVQLQVEFNRVW